MSLTRYVTKQGYYKKVPYNALWSLETTAKECWRHSVYLRDFVDYYGLQDQYLARHVIQWLGY